MNFHRVADVVDYQINVHLFQTRIAQSDVIYECWVDESRVDL